MNKLEIWLGFVKFLLGTVALGLVTTFVNKEIQDKEVALKEIEQKRAIELREQEQLGKFIEHALEEDVGVRLRFSQYFATVTRSNDLRARWIEYNNQVESEYKKTQSLRDELFRKIKEQELTSTELSEAKTKINELERQLSVKPSNISSELGLFSLQLTENFTLGELVASQTADRLGIDNTPNGKVVANLYMLSANVLEPIREHFQTKVNVLSGYRSTKLNQKIMSNSKSQHITGHAVDLQVTGHANLEVACWIKENLEFDTLELAYYAEENNNDGLWVGVSFVEGRNRKKTISSRKGKPPVQNIDCNSLTLSSNSPSR